MSGRLGPFGAFGLFLAVALGCLLPAFFFSLSVTFRGLSGLMDLRMLPILWLAAFFLLCVLSYFHMVRGQVALSSLLVPCFAFFCVGAVDQGLALAELSRVLALVPSQQTTAFLFVGLFRAGHSASFGALGAAALCLICALAALVRGLRGSQWLSGWKTRAAFCSTALLSLALLWVTCCLGVYQPPSMHLLSLFPAVAVLLIAVGWTAEDKRADRGAPRLVLAVAACSSAIFVFFAVYTSLRTDALAAVAQAEATIAPMAAATRLSREALVLGSLGCAVVVACGLFACLHGARRSVTLAARNARMSAVWAATFGAVACALLCWSLRSEAMLFERVGEMDASFQGRGMPDYLPAYSPFPTPTIEGAPTVSLTQEGIWIDGHFLTGTKGFSAAGPSGRRFRDRWIDSLAALPARPSEGDSLGTPLVVVDRRVPFFALSQVGHALRGAGASEVSFLVSNTWLTAADLSAPDVPAPYRLLPQSLGVLTATIGPLDCAVPPRARQMAEQLNLLVYVTNRGFRVTASGGVLPEVCASWQEDGPKEIELLPPDLACHSQLPGPFARHETDGAASGGGPALCEYNWAALEECLSQVHDEYPEETFATVAAEPSVPFQAVIAAMDLLRSPHSCTRSLAECARDPSRFADVFLFLGRDPIERCQRVWPR